MLANTQNSVIISKRKDLMISKTGLIGMADRRVLIQLKKIYRTSGQWDNLILDSFDVGVHPFNISEVLNCRTNRM